MSNIRDLQKLKNTRFSQPLGSQTHRTPNPEQNHFNYEPISLQIPQNKPSRSTQYAKESLRATPSKVIHKRGASFGTPDNSERHTFNLMQNPRLSMFVSPNQDITSP